MPMLLAQQPSDALHSRHLFAPHLSSASTFSAPAAAAPTQSGASSAAKPSVPAITVPKRKDSNVSITGVVCDCEDSPYDEVGCISCLEKALAAMENPSVELQEENQVINQAEEIQALQDYANGVFCTCKNSEYDEVGCDTCIERAFKAMAH